MGDGCGSAEPLADADVDAAPHETTAFTRLADEQAALRRVARLVTHGAAPSETFAAVAREVGALVCADVVHLARYQHDGIVVALAGWAREGETLPAGASTPYTGRSVLSEVLRTGRPVRIDDYDDAFGSAADRVRSLGLRAAVGAPIIIDGRVWGVVVASSKTAPLPVGTEERIAGFTELVATALTNAASQEQWRRLTHEPAALERVATLVARAVPAEELCAAVAAEVGTLIGADLAAVVRFDDDRQVTALATWSASGTHPAPGHRWALGERDLWAQILDRGRPSRTQPPYAAGGPLAGPAAGCPIVVEDEIWGVLSVHAAAPLPPGTESRLGSFAEAANARARREARRLADEQAALRRVATLVARERSADEVFDAIADEMRALLNVEDVRLARYAGDELEVVAMSGPDVGITPVGTRLPLTDGLSARVLQTGEPQRIDGDEVDTAAVAAVRGRGYRTIVAVPLTVQGQLWGVLIAGARNATFERGIEGRLAEFAELMGLAVANLQAREELASSRARLVAAADEERRRVVRDLHDGAQQRLVHAIVTLKLAQSASRSGDLDAIGELIGETLEQADHANREIRDLAHGIMPATLTRGGLRAAVDTLADRAALPVDVAVDAGRLPPAVEATAYFLIMEALTNVTKHAAARHAAVAVRVDDGVLHVDVSDDGVGGASATGSGILGLADRVAAFGGTLEIESPPEGGTRITASIPIADVR
jgi:signal transduction histidine kinase